MRPEIWLKLFLFNSVFDSLNTITQDSDITHFKTNTINFYNKFNLFKAKKYIFIINKLIQTCFNLPNLFNQ